MTGSEFMAIALSNPDYLPARKILQARGLDFTPASCRPSIITQILTLTPDDFDNPIFSYIAEANATGRDIDEVIIRANATDRKTSYVENFFKSFEDEKTPERLFIIIGETGVGKSYMVEKRYPDIPQYACNKSLDPYSLCYFLADIDGTGLKPYETPFLERLKKGGAVFLDEISELSHETLMFIQGLTDEKKTVVIGNEVIHIAKTFRIIATMNPPSETDERTPLGDAILGRAVGIVFTMTDDLICSRLDVTPNWLNAVRTIYTLVAGAGMMDVRALNFRDYQRFSKYDFETQFKFKMCMGDVTNIEAFEKIQNTVEYEKLLKDVIDARG